MGKATTLQPAFTEWEMCRLRKPWRCGRLQHKPFMPVTVNKPYGTQLLQGRDRITNMKWGRSFTFGAAAREQLRSQQMRIGMGQPEWS